MVRKPWRLAGVSYLNTRPLVYGLEADPRVELAFDVPAKLASVLSSGQADAALVPVVDLARNPGLHIVSGGCIASSGPTLTVRVFSRIPLAHVRTLALDGDSHTSAILLRVLLKRLWSLSPNLVDGLDTPGADAVLAIGDKVVARDWHAFPVQVDLGEAWFALTGLPFVFAVWASGASDTGPLGGILDAARAEGLKNIDAIAREQAAPRGWPELLAREYLAHILEFGLTPRHHEGLALFLSWAREDGLLQQSGSGILPLE